MAHPEHESVRRRYGFRCGYCGTAEADTGGELTIDHYQPVSQGGGDEEENLVYACFRCNLNKAAYFPDAVALSEGRTILHPLRDDLSAHLRENEKTGKLHGLTPTGDFHIAILDLNRAPLIAYRLKNRIYRQSREVLLSEIEALRREAAIYEAYTTLLERMLGIRED